MISKGPAVAQSESQWGGAYPECVSERWRMGLGLSPLSAQQSPSFPRVEGQYMNARNVRQNKHTTKRVSLNEQDHLAPAPPDREAVSASQCSTGDRDELEFD